MKKKEAAHPGNYSRMSFKNVTRGIKLDEAFRGPKFVRKRTPAEKRSDLISFVYGQMPARMNMTKDQVEKILEDNASVHLPARKSK